MNLNDLVFDCYCYIEHEDFMTDEEKQVSLIFEELEAFKGGEIDACAY